MRTNWAIALLLLTVSCRTEPTGPATAEAAAAPIASAPGAVPEPVPESQPEPAASAPAAPEPAKPVTPAAEVPKRERCAFEESEQWKKPSAGTLATMAYPVSEKERPFADRVFTGKAGMKMMTTCMTMKAEVGKEVAWFGVARGYKADAARDETRILLENKYFDGLTDTHILCVSFAGGGDFVAVLPGTGYGVQPLGLLRVYGKVVSVKDGVPRVEAEYVRQFAWGRYCFMMVNGKPAGNQAWRKLCKVADDDIYEPFPDPQYYVDRLGDPEGPDAAHAPVPQD